MGELLERYIQDLRHREEAGTFEKATFSAIIRRPMRLSDASAMIEDVNRKTIGLKAQLAEQEAEMAMVK